MGWACVLTGSSPLQGIDDDQEAGAPKVGVEPSAHVCLYRSLESLADMEETQPDKLEQLIYEVLVQVRALDD